MSDVALTGATRSNLLSLQNTSRLLDQTQLRLSTGRKINNVFDDPINFVASQRLDDKAADLGRLLDGISNSLRTVEAANNGVTAVKTLLDQAQSVIDSAADELAGSNRLARIEGTVDLSATQDLTSVTGIAATDSLYITVTDPNDTGYDLATAQQVAISANDSLADLVANINSLNAVASATGAPDPVITASINSNGGLSIEAGEGRQLRIELRAANAVNGSATVELALADALGIADVLETEAVPGGANVTVAATIEAAPTIDSAALTLAADGEVAARNSLLNNLTGFSGIDNAGDTLTLSVDVGTSTAKSSAALVLNAATIEDLVNMINNDTTIKSLVEASYNTTTGKISIRTLDASVQGIEFTSASNTNALVMPLGFGTDILDASLATGNDGSEYIRFGASSGAILALESQYDDILSQIDGLVSDAAFNGVNLLSGDNLETFFNSEKTSSLNISGADFTSNGLDLSAASFVTAASIDRASAERLAATTTVRDFGTLLTSGLNVIKTRQTFTNNTIRTIEGASDDLTLANEEEEGAKLLALQTRQTLGVTSLSLAAQAQQSILRLF